MKKLMLCLVALAALAAPTTLRAQTAERRQPDERRSLSDHLIGERHPVAGARIVQRRSGLHPGSIRHRPGSAGESLCGQRSRAVSWAG